MNDQEKALAWIDYRCSDLKRWIASCDYPGAGTRAQYVLAHNELVNLRARLTDGSPAPVGYKPATEQVY
jgi:hypothetical protein